jgi:hypothetical protein
MTTTHIHDFSPFLFDSVPTTHTYDVSPPCSQLCTSSPFWGAT